MHLKPVFTGEDALSDTAYNLSLLSIGGSISAVFYKEATEQQHGCLGSNGNQGWETSTGGFFFKPTLNIQDDKTKQTNKNTYKVTIQS